MGEGQQVNPINTSKMLLLYLDILIEMPNIVFSKDHIALDIKCLTFNLTLVNLGVQSGGEHIGH